MNAALVFRKEIGKAPIHFSNETLSVSSADEFIKTAERHAVYPSGNRPKCSQERKRKAFRGGLSEMVLFSEIILHDAIRTRHRVLQFFRSTRYCATDFNPSARLP